jgi:hypothetical protein
MRFVTRRSGDLWRFSQAVGKTMRATWGALKRLRFPLEAILISERWCVAYVKWRWKASSVRRFVLLRTGPTATDRISGRLTA